MTMAMRPPWRQLKVLSKCPSCGFSTSSKTLGNKKDYYKEEKLPVYEFNKTNKQRNRLYVFGTAFHGGIGLENLMRPKEAWEKKKLWMWKPTRHKFAEFHDLTHATAGHGFSLFGIRPTTENRPFIFGCGKNQFSQLGYQAVRADAPMETLLSIVPLPFSGKQSRVLALGAGNGHSLISVEGEGLYSLGDNSSGQCGRRVIEDEQYFGSKYMQKFSRFKDENAIVAIASRFNLSILVTRSGRVLTCGDNNKGQLGRGKAVPAPWEFQELGGDIQGCKITKVVTSGSSSLAIDDKGNLFAWGDNEQGQINPNDPGNILYHPKEVKLSKGIGQIRDVAIGDYFSFILNHQGNVYTWGVGGPALGLGPSASLTKTPTQLPPPLFGCNQFTPDARVVSITSSFFYAAAINSLGDLYTWGKDLNGCLGHGELKYQYFPLRVGLGVMAKSVHLGIDHSLVIAGGI